MSESFEFAYTRPSLDWYETIKRTVGTDDVPNKLPLYQRKGRSKPNFAFLHKSAWKDIPQLAWHGQPTTDAELRAMTPPGFAWAFYEANKQIFERNDDI